MTRKHNRSGAWVEGHFRAGIWIDEHYRHGSTVGEYENPAHDWPICDSSELLTHATTCMWCYDSVFFYRDESGRCVLFDSLGTGWAVHTCWSDHRDQHQGFYSKVKSELNKLGYDGSFYEIECDRASKPVGKELRVSVSGFVYDNYYFYDDVEPVLLHSHSRASTIRLIVLEVFDGNQIYQLLIPEKYASEYPVYSIVDINGTWLIHGKAWYLLATFLRKINLSELNPRFSSLVTVEGNCYSCGHVIESDVSWGFDNEGFLECVTCGEMRGKQIRKEFLHNISSIAAYQNDSTIIYNNWWLYELIQWADENDISEAVFPRDKRKIIALSKLNLDGCYVTRIPDSIGKLRNLQELVISFGEETSIPESIGELINLTKLHIDNNELLINIPQSIGNLNNLKELIISYNEVDSIPENIGNLRNLITLDLRSNQLTSIPDNIGNLRNLTTLNVEDNQLTSIPASISNISNLNELILYKNHLTTIPEDIGCLTNLSTLDLIDNQLNCIPESIGELRNLTNLYLQYNKIINLPLSLGRLSKLVQLNLKNNPIKHLPSELSYLNDITEFV